MLLRCGILAVVVLTTAAKAGWAVEANAPDFDRTLAPLLASRCLGCHSGADPKGGLDLTRREGLVRGGDAGPALTPDKLAESPFWTRIRDNEMPPEHPLPDSEKAVLKAWIEGGAVWGTDPIDPLKYSSATRAGYDWWSLQPLENVTVPEVNDPRWSQNEIDRFLHRRLTDVGLTPSPPASPRALIRRVSIDLTGLPPSPEAVARFEANPSDEAYAAIVDELLASPQYGERWGRHWLDVARFGESNGFERNDPRDNFWPYRDWVVRSLNEDLPYDEFARRQIAGDLTMGGMEGAAAVGFLVAGVHNTVVGSSERMRLLARQDELEEIAGAVGQGFLGLTVNCARCHDHKFDPIRTEEYYRFISALDGIQHGEEVRLSGEDRAALAKSQERVRDLRKALSELGKTARKRLLEKERSADAGSIPEPLATWEFDEGFDDEQGRFGADAHGEARIENGALVLDGKTAFVTTSTLEKPLEEKTLEAWVQLDSPEQAGGGVIGVETVDGNVFDAIVYAEREAGCWMAGSNNYSRTQSFQAPADPEVAGQPVHVAIVYRKDGTISGYRQGQAYGAPYQTGFTRFGPGQSHVVFGLRHLPLQENKLVKGRVLRANLYDRALAAEEVAASAAVGQAVLRESSATELLTDEERHRQSQLRGELTTALVERSGIESRQKKVYTVTPGRPGAMRIHLRGDVTEFGAEVAPGAIRAVSGSTADFGLDPAAADRDRRLRLAEWITVHAKPLFNRVIVNRLWQHHFGIGLVETPSDFGFNGGKPSHPELLEWLAVALEANGYRLKPLHRRIVTSAAYRQSSQMRSEAFAKDGSNRLLWRYPPRRVEAEILRDSMLQAAGLLDLSIGGPGFRDVVIASFNGTTYYDPIAKDDPAFHRRTIYRFVPRAGSSSVLESFDCPDPSVTAPRRSVTTTPLQALSLLNNVFVLTMADRLAERAVGEAGPDVGAQIDRVWSLCLGHAPDENERQLAMTLVEKHGLAALARALFNANEFVVIE